MLSGGKLTGRAQAGSRQERWAELSAPTEHSDGSATQLKYSPQMHNPAALLRTHSSATLHRTYCLQGRLSDQSLVQAEDPKPGIAEQFCSRGGYSCSPELADLLET